MFSSAFVSLLAGLCKNYSAKVTKFGGKMAHGPKKTKLKFGGNSDLDSGICK